MNIWISFVPGSGASTIEMILRSCTSLDTLPVTVKFTENSDCVTAHDEPKQWHPKDKKKLLAKKYISAQDNIFTPIVPMPDMTATEILEHINDQSGIKFYLGPSTFESAEFSLITYQKIPSMHTITLPSWANKSVDEVQKLEKWEFRECISLTVFNWWFSQMQEQWKTAAHLGFICIDTMDIFKNFKKSMLLIIEKLQCSITDPNRFDQICDFWQKGQDKIWKDWKNYVDYKEGNFSIIESQDIVQEAMIQWHLREQGIELKCYGLNTFPNSEEIKQYYE